MMWKSVGIMILKTILSDPSIQEIFYTKLDKAVRDSKNPIDDKASQVVKAIFSIIEKSL